MSKKIVLKVELNCEKCKRRAMKTVAGVAGVDSVQIDSKENKITVIGDADPVEVAANLRRYGYTDILSVGPSKEPDKKQQEKNKEEPKDKNKSSSNPGPTHVIIYDSCPRYEYYWSDENPSACCIS